MISFTIFLLRTRIAAAVAVAALAFAWAAVPVLAATSNDTVTAPPPEAAAIKKQLELKFPGAVVGVIGTLIGVGAGILLALNIDVVVPAIEHVFGVHFLAKDVYYISELPSDLQIRDVGVIAVVSFVLTLLATLYPSWRASKTNPAEALRYE